MRIGIRLAAAAACASLWVTPASAQSAATETEKGWKDTGEFSFVATEGNSDTTTLGLKNKLWRKWDRNAFELNAAGVRSEGTTNRRAVGTPGNFDVEEDSELTAEAYLLNGRFDREVTQKFFWFAGAGWDRNTFAGIQNRYAGLGGVGNIWSAKETVTFRTDYAVSYTRQEDVVEVPGTDETFLGLRVSWAYWHKFGASTEYANDLAVDENLDETTDWRARMFNGVTVTMNESLALKVGLTFLYDHQPSFEELTLFDTTGTDTGTTVLVELDELDTIFTTSLVINFL
ncbi:MAG: DUF481 domain-containing protein [Candidatus Polarisedimenticolia bacterium]